MDMSIFSKKVTPEATRTGVYPKRLSYDERRELNAEYDRRRQTNLPKLPSLGIALILTMTLSMAWMLIKLTTLFIKTSGQSAIFLLFFLFILIAICYGVTFFYVKRILDRLSVSGTKFVIIYLALVGVILGCCHQLGIAPFHTLLSLPVSFLLVATGGHYIATSILAKCCIHFEW